uniref:Retrotransposon gag domain-containing protein n=1 Tax=Oncorhynchus mykiss TaxID=8022 RepID=A0A8K9UM47_ONCMY
MDPATSDPLHSAVEIQGAMLGRHKQELSAARHAVETLATQVSNLTEQVHHLRLDPPATSRAFESPEPRINNPPCYSGEPTECRSFLTQCDIVFSLQPNTYSRSTARVAYVISLLIGRAREWGTAIWEARAECTNQYQDFKEEMIRVFDRSVFGEEASRALSSLCQGNRSITDYSIEFRTLAVSSGWNEPALLARLLEGFRAEVKDEILSREVPSSVDSLIGPSLSHASSCSAFSASRTSIVVSSVISVRWQLLSQPLLLSRRALSGPFPPRELLISSRIVLHPLLSLLHLTSLDSSLSRLTRQRWEWEPSFLSAPSLTTRSTHARIFLIACRRRNVTMMWVTANCSPSG